MKRFLTLFLIAVALATGFWWIYQKQDVAPRKGSGCAHPLTT